MTQLSREVPCILLASNLNPDGEHSLLVLLSVDPKAPFLRWDGVNALRVVGLEVDSFGSLVAPSVRRKNAIWFGDSITEGVAIDGNEKAPRPHLSYAKYVSEYLRVEYGMCAFSGQSWMKSWNDIPPLPGTYQLYFDNHSRLSAGKLVPTPDYVFCNMGTNDDVDNGTPGLKPIPPGVVANWIVGVRSAVGTRCWIYIIVPFNGCNADKITEGVKAYVAASQTDRKVSILDLGPNAVRFTKEPEFSSYAPHPNAEGHKALAKGMIAALRQARTAGQTGDLDGDRMAEVVVTSPWGIGILKQDGGTMMAPILARDGELLGGWRLNTRGDRLGSLADYDGDNCSEIFVSSPWGTGVLKLSGGTLTAPMLAPNGTLLGGWQLNTFDNSFGPVGKFDGDGQVEILVTSPWGIGILKLSGGTIAAPMLAPNGTLFGYWLLNTADNQFGPAADYDGDGRAEILVTSAWGIGILKQSGTTMVSLMMASNGTSLGGWLLNTEDNSLIEAEDYDGDGCAEILVTSPWGLGILRLSGGTLFASMIQPNGTSFGGWLLNTADNGF